MKRCLYNILLPCIFIYCLQSCTTQQQLYYPSRANEPALNAAGDARVNVSYDVITGNNDDKRKMYGLSAQAAVSPINHLGIMGSWGGVYNSNSTHYRISQGSFGVGYYTPFSPDKHWLFEVYGGAGFGKMSANNYYDTLNNFQARITANYTDFFLQPALGYKAKNFSVMFGVRVNERSFNNIQLYQNRYDTLYHGLYSFHEPYLDATYGFKNIRFNFQLLWSQQTGGPHDQNISGKNVFNVFTLTNANASLGVTIFITKDMFRLK